MYLKEMEVCAAIAQVLARARRQQRRSVREREHAQFPNGDFRTSTTFARRIGPVWVTVGDPTRAALERAFG